MKDERVFKRIKELKILKKLQQEFLLILVSLIDDNQFLENKHTFQTIDVDHSGNIDKSELKKAFYHLLQERFEDSEFDELVDRLDFDKNGQISYSEFLSCTLAKKHLDRPNLRNLFLHLDIFGCGYLTKESLVMSFRRRGRTL